jgi:hypothetical protein
MFSKSSPAQATCWIDNFNSATPGMWCYFDSIEGAYSWAVYYSSLKNNTQPIPSCKDVISWLNNGTRMANICHYSTFRIWIYLGHSEPTGRHTSVFLTTPLAATI